MSHLQEIVRWVAGFDDKVTVIPRDRKILDKRQDITGRQVLRVQEVFLLHRQMKKCYDSFLACIRLGNRLTMDESAPVFGENTVILAEKAQLARVLPGEQGLYQLQLNITYTMEDQNGEN